MACSKVSKLFACTAVLLACWLFNASLHVADGPVRAVASEAWAPVVLEVRLAQFHSVLRWGQADVSEELRTGQPIRLRENDLLQTAIYAVKGCLITCLLLRLADFQCGGVFVATAAASSHDAVDLDDDIESQLISEDHTTERRQWFSHWVELCRENANQQDRLRRLQHANEQLGFDNERLRSRHVDDRKACQLLGKKVGKLMQLRAEECHVFAEDALPPALAKSCVAIMERQFTIDEIASRHGNVTCVVQPVGTASVRYLASENGTPEVAYIELAACIGSINGGTSLLLHAAAEARNVGARVFILRADPAAVEFWQNLGFANTVYDDDLAVLESLIADIRVWLQFPNDTCTRMCKYA